MTLVKPGRIPSDESDPRQPRLRPRIPGGKATTGRGLPDRDVRPEAAAGRGPVASLHLYDSWIPIEQQPFCGTIRTEPFRLSKAWASSMVCTACAHGGARLSGDGNPQRGTGRSDGRFFGRGQRSLDIPSVMQDFWFGRCVRCMTPATDETTRKSVRHTHPKPCHTAFRKRMNA